MSSRSETSSISSTPSSRSSLDIPPLLTSLDHVNLLVPPNTLHIAKQFYIQTLGLTSIPVPSSKKSHLAWFAIGHSNQQVHITSEHDLPPFKRIAQSESPQHLCFKVSCYENLERMHSLLWKGYCQGGEGAPMQCDVLGEDNAGTGEGDFPMRFFARDFAGNRLEFTL